MHTRVRWYVFLRQMRVRETLSTCEMELGSKLQKETSSCSKLRGTAGAEC